MQADVGDYLRTTEDHFNGSIGLVAATVDGFNKIPNSAKRTYAYNLSKKIPVKSGKIFQGAKNFSKATGKLAGKLGPAGSLTINCHAKKN